MTDERQEPTTAVHRRWGPRALTLGDQVLSSVSNMLAVVLVARAVSAEELDLALARLLDLSLIDPSRELGDAEILDITVHPLVADYTQCVARAKEGVAHAPRIADPPQLAQSRRGRHCTRELRRYACRRAS